MKVVFVTSSSINGGAQKHIREMFRSLTEKGHDIFLVAPDGWLVEELSSYNSKVFTFNSFYEGIKVLSLLIERENPDVINTFILSGAVLGTLAWKRKKIGKLFITVNNPVIYDGISLIAKVLYPKVYRWMSKYANAFLVKSDAVKDEVNFVIRNRIPVLSIKNGVDFTVFDRDAKYEDFKSELSIPNNSIVVTNVAVLHERKGQSVLIDAISSLRYDYPLHLVIVGDGPHRDYLFEHVKSLKADSYIHFLGKRSDINKVLANSDIFVLPSFHEGLPNALMEAMAMGLPCIATDVGGVRQLIDDKVEGVVVPSKSSSSIAAALKYMIDNPNFRKTCGENAYEKLLRTYKQNVVAGELLDIYLNY